MPGVEDYKTIGVVTKQKVITQGTYIDDKGSHPPFTELELPVKEAQRLIEMRAAIPSDRHLGDEEAAFIEGSSQLVPPAPPPSFVAESRRAIETDGGKVSYEKGKK